MSNTGTYIMQDGRLQKISDAVPPLSRTVYFNKGGVPSYDPSARRTFESKQDKRVWLKENKLREGGIINPDQRLFDSYKNRSKASLSAKSAAAARQEHIRSQGGVEGLLSR